jgi:NAD(P)H dehydrogenase (quinone)
MTEGLKVTSDIGIFDFTGIETVEHLLFGSIGYVHEEEYKEILSKVEDTINLHFS